MLGVVLGVVMIFLARTVDVSMGTFRQIMIFRGQRKIGASIGFFEIMIWATAVSQVIPQLSFDRIHYLIAFAAGFACGNFLGSYIEEKVAIGYMFAYVVPNKRSKALEDMFRRAGFGLTTVHGTGLEGPKPLYNIVFKRKDVHMFLDIMKKNDKKAFYAFMDVRSERGGFMRDTTKKK